MDRRKGAWGAGGLVRGIPTHHPCLQPPAQECRTQCWGVPGPLSGEGTGPATAHMLRAACIHAELLSLGAHRCHVERRKEQEARAGPALLLETLAGEAGESFSFIPELQPEAAQRWAGPLGPVVSHWC